MLISAAAAYVYHVLYDYEYDLHAQHLSKGSITGIILAGK